MTTTTKTVLDIQVGNRAYWVEIASGSQELLTALVWVPTRTVTIKQESSFDKVALQG